MTASRPILDPRSGRIAPYWLVYVRSGSLVNVERFSTEDEALSFAESINR